MTKPIFFIHIPKTGGGTIRHIAKQTLGDKYKFGPINQDNINNFTLFQVHTGWKAYTNVDFATILRNPVDRVISHYFWWKYHDNFNLRVTPYTFKKQPSNITLEEFAGLIPNYMSEYVGDSITKFKFIGIFEQYQKTIYQFQQLLGINLPQKLPIINQNTFKQEVSTQCTEYLYALNKEDIKLYNLALIEFNRRDSNEKRYLL